MKIKTFMKKPLSERLQRSLDDLIYCERNPKFKIDMSGWFQRDKDADGKKFCAVCHAGACLAVSINGPVTRGEDIIMPGSDNVNRRSSWNSFILFVDEDGFGKFMKGVNSLRTGDWEFAALVLNLPSNFFRGLGIRKMPDYDKSPSRYKQAFRKIIRFVKAKEKKYEKMGKSMYITDSQ